jgi:uncharacterized protein (TIGR02145 family)
MSNITRTGPSFIMGYWRPWKENSNMFDSYLDYSKDLGLANYTASAVGTYIQEASSQQVNAINDLAFDIGYGLDILSSQMEDVSGQLRFLNRNMDIQIEQQKLSNLLLQNIAELLRVPDSEKERQLSIEMGVKFLVNASKDPDLYNDALEEFHKAEGLRKQDYFVLNRLGTIYLYTEKHMNPEKALEYFLLAGKYASVESDPKAMRLANVMTKSFDTVNSIDSTESIQHLAADSYEKAAFAAYVLGRFDDAENHQKKALKLNPSPQNRFILAKYSVRNGNTDEAVKYLDTAIDEKPELLLAVFKELDLANEKSVLDLVKSKDELLNQEIDKTIQSIRKHYGREGSTLEESLEDLKKEPYTDRLKLTEEVKGCLDILLNPEYKYFNKFSKHYSDESFKYHSIPYQDVIEIVLSKIFYVKIGNKLWMVENLSVDTFRNGDPIPEAKTDEEWVKAGRNEQPAWCWSTDDPEKRKEFGKLYNWFAVNDPRGLAPEGYRIPTDDELEELIVEGEEVDEDGDTKNILNPEIDLPVAGTRGSILGLIFGVGSSGDYWSGSGSGSDARYLNFASSFANVRSDPRAGGCSVRCLKD